MNKVASKINFTKLYKKQRMIYNKIQNLQFKILKIK